MALHVIVDGYNVIHASPRLSALERGDLEKGRDALIHDLARYRDLKRHKVTVVFDGHHAIALPTSAGRRSTVRGVSVVFSRHGQEADDIIRETCAREGSSAVVVTGDGALAASCARYGAVVIAPAEFEERLFLAELAAQGKPEEPEDIHPQPGRKKGPARKPTKRERRERLRKDKL